MDDQLDMRREDHRLRTLYDWPVKFLNAKCAARYGLYYTGVRDVLRCHFCKIEIGQWLEGDDIEADHRRWSPNCSFLQRLDASDIPVDAPSAHPEFETRRARIASFRGWPVGVRQTPEVLAGAGFFYTGSGDQTVCYHCGGGIQDWEDTDEPWAQHALWFSRCRYLIVMKGEYYIRKVISEGTSSEHSLEELSSLSTQMCPTMAAELDRNPPQLPDYRREDHRLLSMRSWPADFSLSAESAARNGLYYFGTGNALRCHFCNVELQQLKEEDDIEAKHLYMSPLCPFVLNEPVGNVSLSRDICDTLVSPGMPVHPAYRAESVRLISFLGWPSHDRHQRPAALADAGFYFTGRGDQTVCYHCGGDCEDWEDDDEPWEQHALWFSHCPYLRLKKGEEYIRKVKSKKAISMKSLEQQNPSKGEIQEDKLCKICYGSDCNVCFVPCGHVVACLKCANSMTNCPVCRQPYTNLVKLFYS